MKRIHTSANMGFAKIATWMVRDSKLEEFNRFSSKASMELGKITKMKYVV